MNEADVMAVDPFADCRDLDNRILFDKMVTARKARLCCDCAQPIEPGTRIRSRSDVYDGKVKSIAWCTECCEAMALSWTDNGEAMEARIRIGTATRAALPQSAGREP